jgi:hypothetical protein
VSLPWRDAITARLSHHLACSPDGHPDVGDHLDVDGHLGVADRVGHVAERDRLASARAASLDFGGGEPA